MDRWKFNAPKLNEIMNSKIRNIHMEIRGIIDEIATLDWSMDSYVSNYRDNLLIVTKFNSMNDQYKGVLSGVVNDFSFIKIFFRWSCWKNNVYTSKLISQWGKMPEFKWLFDCLQSTDWHIKISNVGEVYKRLNRLLIKSVK
jgi:hypothetical protein